MPPAILWESANIIKANYTKDGVFYGWVIVGVAFVVATILIGIRFSFGVFFKSFEGEFALTRAATSSIYSVYNLFCAIFALVSGWAVDRFGPRRLVFMMGWLTGLALFLISRANSAWQLFLGYGLLLSVGTGGTYVVLLAAVSRWFERKRGFALGITGSGAASGTVVVAPLAGYLIATFDWRTALVGLALITAFTVVSVSLLLKNSPADIGAVPDGLAVNNSPVDVKDQNAELTDLTLLQALKTSRFWLVWSIWLLMSLCVNLILAHVVPYATDSGVSTIEAASILSLAGIFNIVFRVIAGRLSDSIGRKIPGIISALLFSGAMLWLIWAHELPMFYVFAIVFGIAWGALGVVNNNLAVDNFGGHNLGIILGAIDVGFATGAALGPALGGLLFDVTGAYNAAFVVGAVVMLIMASLIVLVPARRP